MTYEIVTGSVKHMMPHVPTEEMAQAHPCHVYVTGNPMYIDPTKPMLEYTGTRQECREWIERRCMKHPPPMICARKNCGHAKNSHSLCKGECFEIVKKHSGALDYCSCDEFLAVKEKSK